MITVLQRVSSASVTADNYSAGIGRGLLVFVCITTGTTEKDCRKYAQRIVRLRLFDDENGRMNKSALDINAQLLVVSQFTLAADCKKGLRPSFDKAAPPEKAKTLYHIFVNACAESGLHVAEGRFAAHMQVNLVNDGPVTLILGNRD